MGRGGAERQQAAPPGGARWARRGGELSGRGDNDESSEGHGERQVQQQRRLGGVGAVDIGHCSRECFGAKQCGESLGVWGEGNPTGQESTIMGWWASRGMHPPSPQGDEHTGAQCCPPPTPPVGGGKHCRPGAPGGVDAHPLDGPRRSAETNDCARGQRIPAAQWSTVCRAGPAWKKASAATSPSSTVPSIDRP